MQKPNVTTLRDKFSTMVRWAQNRRNGGSSGNVEVLSNVIQFMDDLIHEKDQSNPEKKVNDTLEEREANPIKAGEYIHQVEVKIKAIHTDGNEDQSTPSSKKRIKKATHRTELDNKLVMDEWGTMEQSKLELRRSMEAEKAKFREEELPILRRHFEQEKVEREEARCESDGHFNVITALINKLN